MEKFNVKALEIYDTFYPERLLEVRFVVDKEDGIFYDSVSRENGYSKTGRTFRSSYFSLMQFYIPSERKKNDEDEFHIK